MFVFGYCANYTPLTVWESSSVGLFVFFFLDFLNNLGKKIVIFDITVILAVATCLVMPVVFYHYYTKQTPIAKLWNRYMPISTDDYFSFAVPAIIMLALGLKIPLGNMKINKNPELYIFKVKEDLVAKKDVGMKLIGIGVISGMFSKVMPGELQQFFYFLAHLIYVGVFYVIYSPSKKKKLVTTLVLAMMVGESVAVGMFGELIFTLAISMILMLLGNQTAFWKKLTVSLSGIFLVLLLQSIKMDYRKEAWRGGGADPVYFFKLIGNRISDPSNMFDEQTGFLAAARMNQGWLIAKTMQYVPAKYPYAYGETIWQSVLASFAPRFLWPDKPEAGGKANLLRFWGYRLRGYSMNIGPMGEAYGNFGTVGGVIYMFFYGLLFNSLLSGLLKRAEKRPTLILWIPFLFTATVTVETDLLTTMNTLTKGIFFTWLIFKLFKITLDVEL